MPNMFSVLNTSRVALLSQQVGIEVTGQNLANVNTENYSRQKVVLETSSPVLASNGWIGTGVKVGEIKRNVDDFLTRQLSNTRSSQTFYEASQGAMSTIETIFNESENSGIIENMNRFFNSFQELSVNAKSMVERSAVIGNAELLTDDIQRVSRDLTNVKNNTENQVQALVTQANTITSNIALYNKQIHQVERGNLYANDLRDKRDTEVRKLAEILDINTYLDPGNNEFIVTTTEGRHLVLGETSFDMETSINGDNYGLVDLNINDGQGNLTNITNELQTGKLQGYINMRDTIVPNYQGRLDKLAAGIIREVNRLHSSGYDLDKKAGVNFFEPLTVTARANTNNAGSATIAGTVGQQGFVSTDDYRIDVTGSGSFDLYNVSTGATTGSFTFSSGTAVDLGNGIFITLTGSAQSGDQFTFSSSEFAAQNMRMNSVVKNSSNRIAAGATIFPGDGSNANAISEIQNQLNFQGDTLIAGSGSVTFQEYYGAIVSDVGIESMKIANGIAQENAIYKQLFDQRENIAGVSIDEEMVNIIKFQQAYNASAKLISTVDEMLNTLHQAV